jgi:uncharacterized protein YdhG (YjbR/CyaY superfamily)
MVTMAQRKPATKPTAKSVKRSASTPSTSDRFTDEELAAMRERAREVRAARSGTERGGESEVLAKIAAMSPPDRAMAERLHAIVKIVAPELSSRLWYGMPAYTKDGKVICFFQDAKKFKTRYATLGFSDKAKLDDGNMWPNSYALKELTAAEETRIVALVKKAVS